MRAYRRIVVATDFSPGSRAVLGAVEALAGKEPVGVHLVHVLEPIVSLVPGAAIWHAHERSRRDKAREELARCGEILTQRLGSAVRVRTELSSGPPDIQICRLADRVRAHLVIVGSHGRTGVRRAVLGSVAERVARFAKRPVLICPLAGVHRRRA